MDIYDKAREWLVNYVKGTVYEYGTVEVPGVSDIDCIVVTEEPLDIPEVPDEFKVQFEGRVFAQMKPEHFKKVKLLGDIKLRKLSGEGYDVNEYDYDLINVLQVMDWLPERIVRLSKVKDNVLGYANSLRYSVDLVKKITGFGTLWSRMFSEFRKGWLENKDEKRLRSLAEEGLEIGGLCIDRFAKYVERYYEPFDGDIDFYLYDTWVRMPKVWQTHLVELTRNGGIVGEEIKKRIRGKGTKGEVAASVASLIASRMTLCNSMAEFTRKGLYRFGHIL